MFKIQFLLYLENSKIVPYSSLIDKLKEKSMIGLQPQSVIHRHFKKELNF